MWMNFIPALVWALVFFGLVNYDEHCRAMEFRDQYTKKQSITIGCIWVGIFCLFLLIGTVLCVVES